MNRITRRRAAMLIATAATATLVSVGAAGAQSASGEAGPVTLTFMRTGTPSILHPIFDPIIAEFEKQNPDITVDMQDLGWADAATSLSVMAASKTLPDVMYHLPGTVFDMAQKGLVLDLTGKLSAQLTSDIYPALLKAGQYDGKQYLVPSGASTLLLWYNAKLFEAAGLDPDAPPATWDEMLAAANKIHAATGVPGLGLYSKPAGGETSFVFESLFASQIGGSAWDSSKNAYVYDDPAQADNATATLKFMQDMVAEAQPSVVEYGRFDTRTLLRDGKVAMVMDSVNMAVQIKDQLADGTMRVARIPAGASGASVSAINVGGWYIPTNSQHPEAAIRFLEFLMTTQNQIAHTSYGSVPILKSEAATYTGDYWKTITDSVTDGVAEGVAPDTPALWAVTGEQLQALLTGDQSPADTLGNIRAGHDEVYDKR